MSRRRIEDEAEARRCLLAIEREGWDIRTWAHAHGVDGRSLHAWRVNLARSSTRTPERRQREMANFATSASELVELVPAPVHRIAPTPSNTGRYVLAIGDARVEFTDDFSEPTLRRIIGVLRSC
jgi:hypothetical protein